jgi:hypothetical protein
MTRSGIPSWEGLRGGFDGFIFNLKISISAKKISIHSVTWERNRKPWTTNTDWKVMVFSRIDNHDTIIFGTFTIAENYLKVAGH